MEKYLLIGPLSKPAELYPISKMNFLSAAVQKHVVVAVIVLDAVFVVVVVVVVAAAAAAAISNSFFAALRLAFLPF